MAGGAADMKGGGAAAVPAVVNDPIKRKRGRKNPPFHPRPQDSGRCTQSRRRLGNYRGSTQPSVTGGGWAHLARRRREGAVTATLTVARTRHTF